MEKIHVSGKTLVDSFGRERIFNGMNICDKGVFNGVGRDFDYEWDDDRIELFKERGFNLVRLGVTWEAIEPEKGIYNEKYIEAIRKFLDKCEENGMYAYLDMHQDLYSGFGNGPGDGAPAWATHTDKYKYKNPKLVWAESYFISKATHRAFDNFWDDKYGDQTAYRNMWQHIAKELDGHPALMGFDIMNEPFLGKDGGKVFRMLIGSLISTTLTDKRISKLKLIKAAFKKNAVVHALDLYPGEIFNKIVSKTSNVVNKFDRERYMPFMDKTAKSVREVSEDVIIFLENCYYSNLGVPCAIRPIEVDGKREPNQLFAPHAYDLMVDTPLYKYASSSRVKSIFNQRKKEQDENLNMPIVVGEWGGDSEGTEWLPHVEFLLDLFDSNKWSNTYWCYYRGFFERPLGEVLRRPYPRAVTGSIVDYKHDRDKNTFTLTYNQDKKYDAPTEIFAHKEIESVETDGKYEIDGSVVKIKTGKGIHTVKITFKGDGFSYTKKYNG